MTARHVSPEAFGYLPAREAREDSERFLGIGLLSIIGASALLFALAFLVASLLPVSLTVPPIEILPHDPGTYAPAPPATSPAAPARPTPARQHGAPLIVPDASVTDQPVGGPSTGEGREHPVVPIEGVPPPVIEEPTPDPGTVVFLEEFPQVVSRVIPEYPDLAREAGVEGRVVLWALIDRDGHVMETRVRKSVLLLDDAARDAVSRWRFTPGLQNGHPVRVWVAIPVEFRLH